MKRYKKPLIEETVIEFIDIILTSDISISVNDDEFGMGDNPDQIFD